ncbi:adenosine kinase [Lithohypha guttulata]|uniref:Adenosine kinase n=1 Tax=Lithohypha guttulata TaxID=1690604 RepID=A0AAN7T723_9EURO|nr:adenosine kinase [Lithohypha guttulata]KAK5090820.1 adenosine kinase [Lithohypha guttulata]
MASTQSYPLLCLENPLLDIQGEGSHEMIEKYGMKLNDTVLAEPHQLGLYDDLINNHNAKLIAGGGAQNTARGAQYMLPEKSVWYVGCVGDDEYANILREACKKEDLAAANEYKLEHLKQPHIWSMVEASKVYYVGGYHLTVCVPAAMALAEHAAANNKPFMLGLAAGFIPQFFKDQLAQILPYCDYLFGNENEAQTWATTNGHAADTSIPEIAKLLANVEKVNKQRPRTVIITQGTNPTIVAVTGENEVRSYPVLAIDNNLICDTTGAGDAYAAGFVAGVVSGDDIETSVKKGQWLAKLSIQELGPSYPFPKKTYGEDEQ